MRKNHKNHKHKFQSKHLLEFINKRSIGLINVIPRSLLATTEKFLPFYWKSRSLNLQKHNKIFSSQWITNDRIVYGTKCNKLFLYNFEKETAENIPLIKGISREIQCPYIDEPATNFGIHAMKKNVSGTLLATGGENVNSIGIYKVPDMEPSYLLEDFHEDAVFDICWLDDSHIATCSRDSKMGIWNINPENGHFPVYYSQRCLSHLSTSSSRSHNNISAAKCNRDTTCDQAYDINYENLIKTLRVPDAKFCLDDNRNKFRAMEYIRSTSKLLIATMTSTLYTIDPIYLNTREKAHDTYQTVVRDLVSIRQWPAQPNCFAVGGHSRFSIYDSRCRPLPSATECINVLALQNNCGIRSLAFKDYVISYGTAEGHINFFDLRNNRHLMRPTSLYDPTSSVSYSQYDSPSQINSSNYCINHPTTRYSPLRYNFSGISNFSSSSNNQIAQLNLEGIIEPTSNSYVVHPHTAIYTHEYDPSFTKLFAGGGPIAACINGQAASLFE